MAKEWEMLDRLRRAEGEIEGRPAAEDAPASGRSAALPAFMIRAAQRVFGGVPR